MTHKLNLSSIEPVTHDTFRLVFPRPEGYAFEPGQATEMALDRPDWQDEKRPFTFTSLPSDDHLELIIKSYPSHDGVTKQIAQMSQGDSVLLGDPWGAIEDRGPGTIIAGGAGITPFIAILRSRLAMNGTLEGYRLIFSNRCEKDIILKDELQQMQGLETDLLISNEQTSHYHNGRVDGPYLDNALKDFSGTFYVCGPPPMEEAVCEALAARGVSPDRIVKEADE